MCNTPGFSGKKPVIEQSGVVTFQRCFPQNPGKFCTLINTQFGVGNLQSPINAADHQRLFAPVELKRFSPTEF